MRIVKKNTYNEGGKLTKKGGKQVKDSDLAEAGKGNTAARTQRATENTKTANKKIKELKAEYQSLSPEERKGEKGQALVEQINTERDSKRGQSKYDRDLATNKSGKVRVISKKLNVK